MKLKFALSATVFGLTSLNAAAVTSVSCGDSAATIANAGYISCQGALGGNIAAGQTDSATFAGFGTFDLVGTSDNAGFGPFSAHPGSGTSGSLSFDSAQLGYFVLGIKGGPTYSLYLFNGGPTGITSLNFDTLGVANGNGGPGPGLSHLALFAAPVPEPGTYALMLAGLAVVGSITARRRTLN